MDYHNAMKTILSLLFLSVSLACAETSQDLKRIEEMTVALQSSGVTGILAMASANALDAPWIPDKWHVENILKEPERIRLVKAGREFGIKLAQQLEIEAKVFQALPSESELFEISLTMCALAEWVNKPDGIGNLLLTGKCLDLAGVGLGRLTADIDFPLKSCQKLAARIRQNEILIDVARRARILDVESGTHLFAECHESDDMEWVWVAGARQEGRNPKGFFAHVSLPDPPTVVNCLVKGGNHRNALVGVRPRSMTMALGLLDFRTIVGYFPKPWVRREAERIEAEKAIADGAKFGIKVNRAEDNPRFDSLEYGFQKAWKERVAENQQSNGYRDGFRAFKKISDGCFFDEDTDMIHLKQDGEGLIKEDERKREKTMDYRDK